MQIFVHKARTEKGLSVERLAELCDVSASHISNVENGKKNPTLKVMCKIADALNVPCCELFSCDEYCDKVKEICKPMNIH